MSKISEQDLEKRAEFFSKHLFGIKYTGEISFVPSTFHDDYTGDEKNENYLGAFLHHENSWDIDLDDEDYGVPHEYEDEINLESKSNIEDCAIEINEKLADDVLRLNDVLLHELIHFVLWYQGLDHMDGAKQFEDTLKKYDISSNYRAKFNKQKRKWEFDVDIEQMKVYEDMYQNYINNMRGN